TAAAFSILNIALISYPNHLGIALAGREGYNVGNENTPPFTRSSSSSSSGSEPGEPSPREGVWPTPANTRGYAARFRSVAVAIRPRTGTRRDGLLYESWIVKTMKSAEQGLNRHLPELLEAIRGGTPQERVEASGRLFGLLIRAMPSRARATPI